MIKLNLGGCEKREGGAASPLLEGFTHVDINSWPGVDVVCDIRILPWQIDSVEEIRASHVIEHFASDEIPNILLEWRRVLIPEGLLRIYCPDTDAIVTHFTSKKIDIDRFSDLIFGGQTYKENLHRVAINRKRLDAFVEAAGFIIVGRLPRPNAYPYDLGVQAVKI